MQARNTSSQGGQEQFHISYISTGDMFRAAMANETGNGCFRNPTHFYRRVGADEMTNGIVKERLAQMMIKKLVSCWTVIHGQLIKLTPWIKSRESGYPT